MWNDPKYTQKQQVAKLVLIDLGGRLGDLWVLAGKNHAGGRAAILSHIQGGKRLPQSKTGFNVVKAALYDFFGAVGECDAAKEHSLFQIIALESGMETK